MGGDEKQPEANTHSPDKEEAKELRRILQSDDIAPVDYTSYGRRIAQIIQRAVMGYWRSIEGLRTVDQQLSQCFDFSKPKKEMKIGRYHGRDSGQELFAVWSCVHPVR